MTSTFNHNRKRNSSLVYEFMVRHMARSMIDRDLEGYQRTCAIARRYFGPTAYLSRELELFDSIRSSRGLGLGEAGSRRVLREVLGHASRLDHRLLDIKKSNMIKDVNYSFGREFYSRYRIPEYRLLASLQLLFNSTRLDQGPGPQRVAGLVQLEEGVVRYMMSPAGPTVAGSNPDVDRLVCAMTAKKIQEKYGRVLGLEQRRLLEVYVRSIISGDTSRLEEHMAREFERVGRGVDGALASDKEVVADPIMRERLLKAQGHLRDAQKLHTPEAVQELLLFQKLTEEFEDER